MNYSRGNPAGYQLPETRRERREVYFRPKPLRLKQLVQECWKLKTPGLALVGFLVAAGVVFGLLRPKTYTATVVMSPASDATVSIGGGGGGGSLVSQVQGLASLAGLGGVGDQKKYDSLAVLQSEALTDSFIQKYNLLPVLFSSQWDKSRGTWKRNSLERDHDLWRGYSRFKEIRTVAMDPRTSLITLTIAWKDPTVAATWANDLVRMANDSLRQKAITQSDRNIAYLNQQAAHTSLVEEQQAISSVLQSEITRSMLARGNEEYAFKVLDPALASDKPSSLGYKALGAIGLLVGLLLWFVIVMLRLAWDAP